MTFVFTLTDNCDFQEAGRRYGYLPRQKRMQAVHEMLWYLIYGYGKQAAEPQDLPEQTIESQHFDVTYGFVDII